METMSPQQGSMAQTRSGSTGEGKVENKKMKTLAQRRQSAPSMVISKALTKSRSSSSRDNLLSPVRPESCPLVQSLLLDRTGRVFLEHAQTQLKTGLQTQDRHLLLFTDTLLVAKTKSAGQLKVKSVVRVCEMWLSDCMEEVCEGSTSPERSFVLGWPTCNYVVTFSSPDLKEKWLQLIQSRISEEKEKDDPKTIPLKVFAKDMGNCAFAKTLAVSHGDTTTDVIRTALLQFGIPGSVKDHQLWVSSSRDDPPYPLIGHEFPFSIKMSHIRDGGVGGVGGVGGGARDPASPSDCPGVLLLDQCLPPDTQCQFILKPSRVAPHLAALLEPGQQKAFKRKRSLINWGFWKTSNTQLDGHSPTSPGSPPPLPGRLFCRPLADLCQPHHRLPKPVMEMLVTLYREGPYTRGVFRRSAGVKACRELRHRLDHGEEEEGGAELTEGSVFVTAAVLKDFLRNIPGALLCVDLYDQWMTAMQGEGRAEAVRRLLKLLPGENLLLLRHVIAVLHCIQGNAHDNQMNAFNLSVCIAPSMLWAPRPNSPLDEGESTKKVCELVHFLIENCSDVMGSEVVSLLQSYRQKTSSEHGSDVSSFQMNDSSYDSLENELNDEPESPEQEQLPLLERDKHDSRSRDSVITLSDPEPDPEPEADPRRRVSPAHRQPRPLPAVPVSGPRRLRRSSEPALAVGAPHSAAAVVAETSPGAAGRKASYDAAAAVEEEEEVFLEQGLSSLQLQEAGRVRGERGGARAAVVGRRKPTKYAPPPPLRLDASCSSLSSPATSPTGSSLSSLDSAFSQYSTDYTAGHTAASPSAPAVFPSADPSPLSPLPPRDSPPAHGLHPNTWLRKDRRLSLRQPDEEEAPVGGAGRGGKGGPKQGLSADGGPPSYQQALVQLQRSRAPFYRVAERPLTVRELRQFLDLRPPTVPTSSATTTTSGPSHHTPRAPAGSEVGLQPPKGVFYGQNATTLVLQRNPSPTTPTTLTPSSGDAGGWERHPSLARRSSEPCRVPPPSYCRTLDRPGASPEVKGHQHEACRQRVSNAGLSSSASKAVRDYFSRQGGVEGCANQRSQEVALALVQGRQEWDRRRCSDPRADDFDQLFFAEESYV
ncbi:rho GTPase-activating protein 20 isoform X3 [Gadus morhua]|uniref:rho GTPase-activating protein 20 isoform X3 n=1 Tax=Gadus morhua TaxID=8049 RepID=UPI0011B565D0|nr:rho GTPase-activating protein 20-like isoform X3 [Gadus morhua]